MRTFVVFLFLVALPVEVFPASRLIEVCGIDGAGKSTFIQDMKVALSANGREVHVLRPVSGDPAMYKFLDGLDVIKNTTDNPPLHERIDRFKSEYFLLTFLNHKAIIDRLLLEDCDILCDRYLFSFKTYQECFNQLSEQDQDLTEVLPKADIIYLITLPVDLAMSRIEANGKPAPYENPEFLNKAQKIFLDNAKLYQNLVHLNGGDTRSSNIEKALSTLERINDSKK